MESDMNGFAFIASLVGSLAWPSAALGIAWMFRSAIRDLLFRIQGLKHNGTELLLGEAEKKVAEIELAAPSAAKPPPAPVEEVGRFMELLAVSPSAAVLEERRALENAVRQRATDLFAVNAGNPQSFGALVEVLRRKKEYPPQFFALLQQLQILGNQAAHSASGISESDALRYRDLARQARAWLLW